MFAKVLAHELAHAVAIVRGAQTGGKQIPFETYPSSEYGYDLDSVLFGGFFQRTAGSSFVWYPWPSTMTAQGYVRRESPVTVRAPWEALPSECVVAWRISPRWVAKLFQSVYG